jgi:PAS domain-containing protein
MPDLPTPNGNAENRALAEALATTDVLRRVAGTVAIHLYEMEYLADGTYVCNTFIGEGLESLVGPLPEDRTPEEAWDDAVHPDDREAVDAASELLHSDQPAEVEYRLVGYDGRTRWVWDRMRPRRTMGASSSTGSSPTSPSGSEPRTRSSRRAPSCSTSPSTIR